MVGTMWKVIVGLVLLTPGPCDGLFSSLHRSVPMPFKGDGGQPLFLTPYIEAGNIKKEKSWEDGCPTVSAVTTKMRGKRLSIDKPSKFDHMHVCKSACEVPKYAKLNKTNSLLPGLLTEEGRSEIHSSASMKDTGHLGAESCSTTLFLLRPTILGKELSFISPFPGWNMNSYAGFLTVNKTYNSNLFMWFFPAQVGTRGKEHQN
ncbi:hypothetical protein P7K49_025159 [Saguinus oedipus]|uniref:Uncharacterized protein n=1 Tax=Saguinus oedipus TaxID=9490 RepID=A0ABQ9UGF6_SAGOE|nr:hypothetical protein P7K49_025159 [Saguinus oedipus]